jgi:hypothetical protein
VADAIAAQSPIGSDAALRSPIGRTLAADSILRLAA